MAEKFDTEDRYKLVSSEIGQLRHLTQNGEKTLCGKEVGCGTWGGVNCPKCRRIWEAEHGIDHG